MLGRRMAVTWIVMSLVAALLLSLAGCSSTKTTEQPAQPKQETPQQQPAPQAPAPQKVEIVMGHPFAAQHPISQKILIPLAQELSDKSGGRITLTIHAGGSVTSPATIREDVATGVIDMGWTLQGYTPGKYPLTDVIELPFQYESTLEASHVLWQLFQQSPDLQNEYGDVRVVGLWVTDPGEFISKKPIRKPEDLKGLRLRFSGKAQESLIKSLGGTPVGMAMPEVYDALQRGIIDGVANGPSVIESYKLNEVVKYTTRGLNSFYSAQVIFMNKKKWDSLSPDDQNLLASLTGEVIYKKATDIYSAGYQKGLDMAKASNVTIIDITPQERESWRAKTTAIVDEWLKSTTDRGLNGKAVLDLMQKLTNEYRATKK